MNAEDQFSDDGGVPLHHLKTRAARGMTFKILYFADILSVYTDRFFGVDVMRCFFCRCTPTVFIALYSLWQFLP
jgi:hypothetical protein